MQGWGGKVLHIVKDYVYSRLHFDFVITVLLSLTSVSFLSIIKQVQ